MQDYKNKIIITFKFWRLFHERKTHLNLYNESHANGKYITIIKHPKTNQTETQIFNTLQQIVFIFLDKKK